MQSQTEAALARLQVARGVLPDSPDVLLATAQGHLLLRQGDAAREMLTELIALADGCNLMVRRDAWAKAHLILAELEPQQAREHRERMWAIDPRTAAEAAFLEGRRMPRVLRTFKAEAEEKHWDWYSQANYGWALLKAGRAADAVAPLRKASRLAPERETVRYRLAEALAATDRSAEAARLLDGLLRTLPPGKLRHDAQALRDKLRRGR